MSAEVQPEGEVDEVGDSSREPWWSPRCAVGPLSLLAAVALWLALPVAPMSEQLMRSWSDQLVLLSAFEHLLSVGDGLAGTGTAPGYLALAWTAHAVTRAPVADSLVLVSRASLLIAYGTTLLSAVGRVRGRLLVSLPALLAVATLSLLTPTAFFSGFPWTHMPACALGMLTILGIRLCGSAPAPGAALTAGSLTLLLQTRNFEAQVLIICLLVCCAVLLLSRRRPIAWRRVCRPALTAVATSAGVWAAVALVTGQWQPYEQYAATLSASDRTLTPASFLASLPQVFVDPCYRSICALSDYPPESRGLFPTSTVAWQAPLLNQLPAFAVAFVFASGLVVVTLRRRSAVPVDVGVALLASVAFVVAYCANPVMGGAHLKYGVARDFLLPTGLAIWSLGRLLFQLQNDATVRAGARRATLVAALACAVAGLAAVVPLPRLTPTYARGYEVTPHDCVRWPCDVTVTIADTGDDSHKADGELVLVSFCRGVPQRRLAVGEPLGPCDGTASIGVLPRSFGAWMTPEGDRLIRDHQVVIR